MYEEFPSKQFSGGLDSAVIAALADRLVPAGEQIDLINVAFAKTAMVFELERIFFAHINQLYVSASETLFCIQMNDIIPKVN